MHVVYPFYQSMDVIRNTKKTYYGGDSFKTACKLYINKDGPKDATLRFVSEFFPSRSTTEQGRIDFIAQGQETQSPHR